MHRIRYCIRYFAIPLHFDYCSLLTYVIVVIGGIDEVSQHQGVQQHVQSNSYPAIKVLLLPRSEHAPILPWLLVV